MHGIEFLQIECDRLTVMCNDRANLIVGCISLDVKRLIMARIMHESFFCY